MYNRNMRDRNFLNFDPYDWMLSLDEKMCELNAKHNQLVNNSKQIAIAFNQQQKTIKDLQNKINTLESILWKNDSKDAIEEYWRMVGRPQL